MREKCRDKQADKPMGESTSAGLSAFLRQVGRAGRMKCGTEVGDETSIWDTNSILVKRLLKPAKVCCKFVHN